MVKNTFIDELPTSDSADGGSMKRASSSPSLRFGRSRTSEGASATRVEPDHPAVIALRTTILERCAFLKVENYAYIRRRKARRALYTYAGALTLFVPTLSAAPTAPLLSGVASALCQAGCSVQWRKGQLYVSDAAKLCVIGVKISSDSGCSA